MLEAIMAGKLATHAPVAAPHPAVPSAHTAVAHHAAGTDFTRDGALPMDDKVRTFILISSSLSIIGCLFIIFSFVLFRDSRKCGRRLLFMLSLADLGLAVSWLAGVVINLHTPGVSTPCIAQGYAMEFFRLSSFMWTGCFAIHLYQIIWKNIKDPEVYEIWYHITAWGIPTLVCVYFVVQDQEGVQMMGQTDRPWCWIRDFSHDKWQAFGAHLQYLMFYGPLLIIFIFNLGVYAFLGRKVGELMQTRMKIRIQKRLLLYLVVFQLTSIWGLANRIYQAWSPGHKYDYFLLCMDSLFGPAQGILNALVYGLNQKLRDRYVEWLCPDRGCCSCCSSSNYGGNARVQGGGEEGQSILNKNRGDN